MLGRAEGGMDGTREVLEGSDRQKSRWMDGERGRQID
jgi:hypothetical protein